MKIFFIVLFLVVSFQYSIAQDSYKEFTDNVLLPDKDSPKELQNKLAKYNFSSILSYPDNSVVYGFIGNNFMRLRIKFITINKSKISPGKYVIYGKSKVKNNIDAFNGILKITHIQVFRHVSLGVDSMYKNDGIKNEGRISGTYLFYEDPKKSHSGIFKGTFENYFYVNKYNKICYDTLNIVSDGFNNNQFTGKWISYKDNIIKTCNWGDYRIPNSGNLDIGAGEFSPDDKYLSYGWQSRRDFFNQNSPNYAAAKKVEEAKWWQ